ncbi:lipoprotein [Lysobacter arseniciresistens ZS79]|uniref:Lipoprotein n=1 Tax=Lysobacter arseniciresistens ZS79 TaxID=913325 RepID=A0A0A0F1W1_9GAMM|nr:lipoprotein [Lysobacter arseniciresistens ZS79]
MRAALLTALLALATVAGCASTGPAVPAAPSAGFDAADPAAAPLAGDTPTATVATDTASVAGDTEPGAATVDGSAASDPLDPASTGTIEPDPTAATAGATLDATAPAPTQAELDYAALYGEPVYNPVADPTLPPPATVTHAYDPWERYNRRMHRFNNAVDRTVARPLARAYVAVVPRPVRLGVSNFFSNLGQPVSAVNALLQGKPRQAAHAIGRFLLNSTLGIGGIFDPASDARLSRRSEDFGQTLGTWGWENSRYVELPLFGPRTVRDVFGMVGDAPLSPLRQISDDATRIPLQGLQLVDVRTQLLATDSLREGAADDYALVRDAWMQRRQYQIFGDRVEAGDETALPDYLQDDSLPLVPAGAVPVMPTDG